jgi:hypothetical protein
MGDRIKTAKDAAAAMNFTNTSRAPTSELLNVYTMDFQRLPRNYFEYFLDNNSA